MQLLRALERKSGVVSSRTASSWRGRRVVSRALISTKFNDFLIETSNVSNGNSMGCKASSCSGNHGASTAGLAWTAWTGLAAWSFALAMSSSCDSTRCESISNLHDGDQVDRDCDSDDDENDSRPKREATMMMMPETSASSSLISSSYFDEDYDSKHLLGSGTFGMVMQCVNKKDGSLVAVKMIQDINDNRKEVEREIQALHQLQTFGGHENIIGYSGAYSHDGFHYIVTEFVQGESLFECLQRHRRLPEQHAVEIIAQLASAVRFLKSNNLVHRDLKPENVLLVGSKRDKPEALANQQDSKTADPPTKKLHVKLIDFGSAGRMAQEEEDVMTLSGTRCYWPPEAHCGGKMSSAMDMWSLGCILYILICGRHPFDDTGFSTEDQVIQRICTEQVSFHHPVWSSVSDEVKELVQRLLDKNPETRLGVEDLLRHSSVAKFFN